MNSSFADSTPPLVVVGSGLAGLFLALHAVEQGPVLIITKTALLDGSTRHAQGGLAAALAEGDTVASHVTDTLVAGAGLCDIDAVETICAEGPRRVRELMDFGVNFDTTDGALQFGREGAHSVNRVIHAGGDATGAHIIDVLAARVAGEPRITVREHTRVVDICVEHGRAAGVFLEDGERVEARAVVLATGGSGHLFARTTNPVGATADGSALAHRAGAMLTDLEFVQFHPTALAFGASPLALVSEAVRGEGAYLRDAHGRRFMLDLHPQAELGPRDVVARAIARQAAIDGVDVTLDLRHLDRDGVLNHFPTVAAACRVHGLDLATDPIPVTPAVHYAMGGVFTDSSGRTTVPDLWAVGECASTGAHGANRLASNSL